MGSASYITSDAAERLAQRKAERQTHRERNWKKRERERDFSFLKSDFGFCSGLIHNFPLCNSPLLWIPFC